MTRTAKRRDRCFSYLCPEDSKSRRMGGGGMKKKIKLPASNDWDDLFSMMVERAKAANAQTMSITFQKNKDIQQWDLRVTVAKPGYFKDDEE